MIAPPPEFPSRRHRIVDLLLVLAFAFSLSLVLSVYLLFSGEQAPDNSNYATMRFIEGLLTELTTLALLICLLSRQGRSLRDIGFRLEWKDFPRTILVWLASMIFYSAFYYLLYYLFAANHIKVSGPANVAFLYSARHSWNLLLAVPFAIINPFFEELIVRAYLISELEYLTGRTWLAGLASVALQVSYHLYQGWFPALCYVGLFGVFTLYYIRARRITPVIFAHMIDDLSTVLF